MCCEFCPGVPGAGPCAVCGEYGPEEATSALFSAAGALELTVEESSLALGVTVGILRGSVREKHQRCGGGRRVLRKVLRDS